MAVSTIVSSRLAGQRACRENCRSRAGEIASANAKAARTRSENSKSDGSFVREQSAQAV